MNEFQTAHAKQPLPHEWRAVQWGEQTIIVHEKPEAQLPDVYTVSASTRCVRNLAKADAVLLNGQVLNPVYREEYKLVEFHHPYAGETENFLVKEWLDHPALRLKELPGVDLTPPEEAEETEAVA